MKKKQGKSLIQGKMSEDDLLNDLLDDLDDLQEQGSVVQQDRAAGDEPHEDIFLSGQQSLDKSCEVDEDEDNGDDDDESEDIALDSVPVLDLASENTRSEGFLDYMTKQDYEKKSVSAVFSTFKRGEIFERNVEYLNEVIALFEKYINSAYQEILSNIPLEYSELLKMVKPLRSSVKLLRVLLRNHHGSKNKTVAKELEVFLGKEQILLVTLHLSNMRPLDILNKSTLYQLISKVVQLSRYKTIVNKVAIFRVQRLAPNLVQLIGPEIANQLLRITNGLKNLTTIPNSNIPTIGKKFVKENSDMVTQAITNGGGILYYTEMVQLQDNEQSRKKSLKMLSGKISLCSRIDYSKSDPTGNMGKKYKLALLDKLQKFSEPPVINQVKALPIPKDNSYVDGKDAKKKKRGGSKITKYRNKFKLSNTHQLQNKMEFGRQEKYMTDAYGEENGLGMAGTKLVGTAATTLGTKDSASGSQLSKEMKKRLELGDNKHTSGKGDDSDGFLQLFNSLDVPAIKADSSNVLKAADKHTRQAHSTDQEWYTKFG